MTKAQLSLVSEATAFAHVQGHRMFLLSFRGVEGGEADSLSLEPGPSLGHLTSQPQVP